MNNFFTALILSDMESCYESFKRNIIQKINIEENRFEFAPELPGKISKKNLRIYKVGFSYYEITYSKGQKIGWRDGIKAIYCIIKYNLFR